MTCSRRKVRPTRRSLRRNGRRPRRMKGFVQNRLASHLTLHTIRLVGNLLDGWLSGPRGFGPHGRLECFGLRIVQIELWFHLLLSRSRVRCVGIFSILDRFNDSHGVIFGELDLGSHLRVHRSPNLEKFKKSCSGLECICGLSGVPSASSHANSSLNSPTLSLYSPSSLHLRGQTPPSRIAPHMRSPRYCPVGYHCPNARF